MQHPSHSVAHPSATAGKAPSKSLVLHGVTKRYGNVAALDALSLHVEPGELVSLLGPSGCGKTTTLRLIAGFEFPDQGAVMIDGKDVSALAPNKRGLGMVFQNYSLFPHLTVGENIGFGLRMSGVKKSDIQASVRRMLDLIRLPSIADRRISQLSGGQQQRVALARAIVNDPSVLLLDEPLGALDKNLREGMQFEIRRLQRDLGITSVMVTHDQEEAMTMSDRIVVMDQGKILQIGLPRHVYDRPRTRFVAEFLGTANIIPCTVVSRGDATVVVATPATSGTPGTVLTLTLPPTWSRALPGNVELAVRPEKIALNAARPGHVTFAGTIGQHIFRGSQHAYEVDVPGLSSRFYACEQASSSAHDGYAAGQPVSLSFSPDDVVVLEPDDPRAPAADAAQAFASESLVGQGVS